jgi:hypothetical protein
MAVGLRMAPAAPACTARSLRPCSLLLPARPLQLGVCPAPARHIAASSSSNDFEPGPSATAYLEAAVPQTQRPVNELRELKDDMLYSWVSTQHVRAARALHA